MTAVIGLAGQIAAGKTTIAISLATRLRIPRVSFGDTVRQVATERGLPADRSALQDLGEELIAAGWEPFCRAVLAQAPWQPGQPLVIDGIRHVDAILTLRELVIPSTMVVVFLEVSPEARQPRLVAKGLTSPQRVLTVDAHSNEHELDSVREAADLVLPNTGDPERMVTALLKQISGPVEVQKARRTVHEQ